MGLCYFVPCFLTVIGQLLIAGISANQASSTASLLQAEKYSSLPHTIFAPDGRLYNIEKNARAASDNRDISSSLVLALKFGRREEECILIISTSHSGSLLSNHVTNVNDQAKKGNTTNDGINDDAASNVTANVDADADIPTKPLWSHATMGECAPEHESYTHKIISRPLSILPSNIIIGTGGTAADATAMHNKILQIALSLCRDNDDLRTTHRIQGTILASMLAKKVANSMQLPTQSAASGRMLASAAIVVGRDYDYGQSSIWRCDATGQFWDCRAAAVGKGAGSAEAEIIAQVAQIKAEERVKLELDNDDGINIVSPEDLQEYLESMTFDDAILLACKCVRSALNLQTMNVDDILRQVGLQGVLVHSRKGSSSEVSNQEYIHPEILRSGLKKVLI